MIGFALLVLVVLGFLLVLRHRKRPNRTTRTAARPATSPASRWDGAFPPDTNSSPSSSNGDKAKYESSATLQSLAAISRRDPNFDVEDFLTQAFDLYMRVDRVRRDGGFEEEQRVRQAIGESAWSALGLDRAGQVKSSTAVLDEPRVAHASTGTVDKIVVRFNDSSGNSPLAQHWTFQRPSTAVTVKPGDVRCRQCGAVDSLNAEGRCRYCGTRPSGQWQLSRVTDVGQLTTPAHVRTAADLVEAMAVLSQQRTTAPTQAVRQPSLSGRFGCLSVLLLVVAVIGLGLYGWLAPRSAVHRVVGTFLPGTRRAKVAGTATVQGGFGATGAFNLWWPSPVRCYRLSEKNTAASFTIAVPGNAAVTTKFETFEPIGIAPRDLHDMTVVVTLHGLYGVMQEWTTVESSTARFVMAVDGSGEASFGGLSPAFPGGSQAPLGGSFKWSCSDH